MYSHQAGLVAILLAATLLLGPLAAPDLAPFREAPATFAISSLLLLSSSANMGILPMYIFFLLATPFALRLLHRGLVAPFFAAILLGWLAAQTNLFGLAMYQVQPMLTGRGIPANFGLYFNLLGRQALFFGGLFVGFRMAQGRLDLEFLRQPQWRTVFFMAAAAVVLLGVYDLVIKLRLLGDDYSTRILIRTDRAILGFFYPLAFAIDFFVIAWLLKAGPQDRAVWVRRAAAGVDWLFTRRFLVVLGQHSLQVFSFHILVYYLLATLLPPLELPALARAAVLVVSIASLYLAAAGHARLQERDGDRRAAGGLSAPISPARPRRFRFCERTA
ncbi:MAG: OpgC domain-containing protein [Rhodobacteraceae bacterium]|nr:OpgC domain-containing protein [Paracoccaceae bacterium]